MIDVAYARTMAAYNRWQNRNLYIAADGLSEAARREDRGAFFKSIHATMNHVLWADTIWMSRLSDVAKPVQSIAGSVDLCPQWDLLKRAREAFDELILHWSTALKPSDLAGDLVWFSGATQREIVKPRWVIVTHVFNHQTHHRGQIHAMLTSAGAKPHETDLSFM